MAPSVLGLGIPASSTLVPDDRRSALHETLEAMEADMKASPYEWEFFDVDPDMDMGVLLQKLREKKWDVVMVGMGLRIMPAVTVFFESIINAVHQELPEAKFAFNTQIEKTKEACDRVVGA